jgi:hypothetical protein
MSKKVTDIISLVSFTICGILLIVRIIRMVLFDVPPMAYLTAAIGFFFLLGSLFLLIPTNED